MNTQLPFFMIKDAFLQLLLGKKVSGDFPLLLQTIMNIISAYAHLILNSHIFKLCLL